MDEVDKPATKGDLQGLEVRLEAGFEGKLDAVEQRILDRVAEVVRDSETRLLQAFYTFAETNQARLTVNERESAAIKNRLSIVESRVTELEKRLNLPPAA